MTIKLYDSLTQSLQDFVPNQPGEVKIYVCGPTVQSAPHIGHLRSALVYDIWRSWFEYRGYQVTLIRNVTDVDDKILLNSEVEKLQWWELAYKYEQEFTKSYAALQIRRPDYEPRATGHITQQVELIQRLIDLGFAYVADDLSGDVYFAANSWPEYGRLTRQNLAELNDGVETGTRAKRDPKDFALWKGYKTSEPVTASWPTPWGRGRPGWHIECSAMATYYLGSVFDIHGGGQDLRFPHHENELAQSNAAGDGFANYWMHNGLVNITGQKMSKSLGNSVFAAELLKDSDPAALRYLLASSHYRSVLDYNPGSLAESEAALIRITGFLNRAAEKVSWVEGAVTQEFADAMDEDLNVPLALSVMHDLVRRGNSILATNEVVPELAQIAGQLTTMLKILGLDRFTRASVAQDKSKLVLDTLLPELLAQRDEARRNKDFKKADQIRDLLTDSGIVLEDNAEGTRWNLR